MFNKLFLALMLSLLMLPFAYATETQPTKPIELIVTQKNIMIDGKKEPVYWISQPDGTWGYEGVKGQYFNVIVKNQTNVPTVIHWHGLVMPNSQDGVPETQPLIQPGKEYAYHFKLKQAGTFWMHSHSDLQLQRYLSAPLIIRDPNDQTKTHDVIMMLADFSPKSAETIFKELKEGMDMPMSMAEMNNDSMKSMSSDTKSMAAKPDLNDVNYAALLTNYRTLKNPEIVRVKPGEKVRLRIINGASATNFFVNSGVLKAELIAADGEDIHPISGQVFQIGEGQRIDLIVTIPDTKKAIYPILAQGEGTKMQTGIILATTDATTIPHYSETAPQAAGALSYSQEWKLKAMHPLPQKPIDETLTVNLEGNMAKYEWKINNQMWPNITPLLVHANHRVEMIINNQTEMAHPIHLHGHVFEVTEIDGKPVQDGAMRDTVLVMPHSTVKVQFDTDNPGMWMLHCHMLYHQAAGMMTMMDYEK
ncbi:MAG: multicopper oxidase family protein [Legionellales bacterium]|nr:multicopper oxidase family protein [Legionellales bacterium]